MKQDDAVPKGGGAASAFSTVTSLLSLPLMQAPGAGTVNIFPFIIPKVSKTPNGRACVLSYTSQSLASSLNS